MTTSAVNENRRPPLTTLATRLISTTRSLSSLDSATSTATSVHLSTRRCSRAAKSKPRKNAGSVRSRRLRARLRTPRGAALQRSRECEMGGRGSPSGLGLLVDDLGVLDHLFVGLGRAIAAGRRSRLGLLRRGLRVHRLGQLLRGLLERLRLGLDLAYVVRLERLLELHHATLDGRGLGLVELVAVLLQAP